jgi:hypothetical protein
LNAASAGSKLAVVRAVRVLLIATSLACALGCSRIPRLADDSCGNGVLESDEDCDSLEDPALGPGTHCARPPDKAACHYVCAPLSTTAVCPVGWGCGVDGACRMPSNRYSHDPAAGPSNEGRPFRFGDLDGDGALDIVIPTDSGIAIYYGDGKGNFPVHRELKSTVIERLPAVGDLWGDRDPKGRTCAGCQDLIIPDVPGLNVEIGRSDRTLQPQASNGFDPLCGLQVDGGIGTTFVPALRGLPLQHAIGFGRVAGQGFGVVATLGACGEPPVDSHLPFRWDDLAGRIATGFIDATGPGAFVLAFTGTGLVHPLQLSCPDPSCGAQLHPSVRLVGPAKVGAGGVFLADLDGDGWSDLVIDVDPGGGDPKTVYVAYGDPLGNFSSPDARAAGGPADAQAGPEPAFAGYLGGAKFAPDPASGEAFPLAVGRFAGTLTATDAGRPIDYVTASGVFVDRPTRNGRTLTQTFAAATAWTEAVVADLDGDGSLDVAAASSSDNFIDLLYGDGSGFFTHQRVATSGHPTRLRVGDFDGDLINDVAYLEDDARGATLSLLYGQAHGGPTGPQFVARISGRITSIEPGLIDFPDLVWGLAIMTSSPSAGVDQSRALLLHGTTSRAMFSPLTLAPEQRPIGVEIAHVDPAHLGVPGLFAIAEPGHVGVGPLSPIAGRGDPHTRGSLWVVPGGRTAGEFVTSRQAVIGADRSALVAGCPDLCLKRSVWTAGDVDGDGLDEFVAIEQPSQCATKAPILANEDQLRLIVIHPGVPTSTPTCNARPLPPGYALPARVNLADLDGDGHLDLMAELDTEEYASALSSQADLSGFGSEAGAVIVLWGNGRPEGFEADAPTFLPPGKFGVPDGAVGVGISGAAGARAKTDWIAIAGFLSIAVTRFDAGARSFAAPLAPIVCPAAAVGDDGCVTDASLNARNILSADVDGDGLPDLLFGRDGLVQVYLAKAGHPTSP